MNEGEQIIYNGHTLTIGGVGWTRWRVNISLPAKPDLASVGAPEKADAIAKAKKWVYDSLAGGAGLVCPRS